MTPRDEESHFGAAVAEGSLPQPVRVFVALKVAADLAQELAGLAAKIAGPIVRRIAPGDIHLTLVPPWREPSIPDAIAKLAHVAAGHVGFELAFRHVGYGPDERRTHLLWAGCVANSKLAALRADLLMAFGQSDERPFRPHITLARIRGNGAKIARKHPFSRDLTLAQHVGSVELMQSPPPGSRGYTVLASIPLAATVSPPRRSAGGAAQSAVVVARSMPLVVLDRAFVLFGAVLSSHISLCIDGYHGHGLRRRAPPIVVPQSADEVPHNHQVQSRTIKEDDPLVARHRYVFVIVVDAAVR